MPDGRRPKPEVRRYFNAGSIFRLLTTLVTPSVSRARFMAMSRAAGVSTAPFSVTTPFLVSTSIFRDLMSELRSAAENTGEDGAWPTLRKDTRTEEKGA